jgi:hypothetical protein
MSEFSLELLQAINDWQCGGDHKQKIRKGERIKLLAQSLPDRFRTSPDVCFRQEAHPPERTWQLLSENKLPETTAAWILDLPTAKTFKGGVPPSDLTGIILKITPSLKNVVVNLDALYSDQLFQASVSENKLNIIRFYDGIGRYADGQREVILEMEYLTQDMIFSYGGFAANRVILREQLFRDLKLSLSQENFDAFCQQNEFDSTGAWWLYEVGTQNVLMNIYRVATKGAGRLLPD